MVKVVREIRTRIIQKYRLSSDSGMPIPTSLGAGTGVFQLLKENLKVDLVICFKCV